MSNGPPWVRFFPSDWLAGTRALTAAETGVYITLVAMMYDRGEPLPGDDPVALARQCNLTPGRFEAALARLVDAGKIFRTDDGGLWNERVQREHEVRLQNANRHRQSAFTRWEKKRSKTNGAAIQSHMGRNAHARVPEPDSTYPLRVYAESGREAPPTASKSTLISDQPKAKKPKQAPFPFAEDWTPDEPFISEAIRLGLPDSRIVAVGESWRDHHRSRGNQFVDWLAAWRKWVRNELEWNARRSPRPQQATGPPDDGAAFRAMLRNKAEGR
jgi:uncharacterized protein YdaU (DUF1376 family)